MQFPFLYFSMVAFSAARANPPIDHFIDSEIHPQSDYVSKADLKVRRASDLDQFHQDQMISTQDKAVTNIAVKSDSSASAAFRFDDPPCPQDSVSRRSRRSCVDSPVQKLPNPDEEEDEPHDPAKSQPPFSIPTALPSLDQLGKILEEKGGSLGGQSCMDPYFQEHLCCDWPESDKLGIPPHEYFRAFENCSICKLSLATCPSEVAFVSVVVLQVFASRLFPLSVAQRLLCCLLGRWKRALVIVSKELTCSKWWVPERIGSMCVYA